MAAATQVVPEHNDANYDPEKNIGISTEPVPRNSDDPGKESDNESGEFQQGVKQVRAVASVWSKKTLWIMFGLLYMVSFVDAIITSIQTALNPYITSSFGKHGLLASVSVISTILGGSSRLSIAKIIDIWGRNAGFMFMLLIVIIGLIMKATCQSVEAYVAAHTLFWVGHIGQGYVIDVMLADMTSLRNRMIMFGINGTPTIASTFAGPKIAALYYKHLNFRWAFGSWAIILVGFCVPVVAIMIYEQRKAAKLGALPEKETKRAWWQSIWHYAIELDVVGIILITAAFSLVLLPFSIAKYAPKGWASGYIIAMEVLGVFSFALFYSWERWFAPVQFLPWKYLKEPTIIGSCVLYGVMFASIFCWNAYFSSYLQVVHRLSITTSNYVLNSFSLSSSILAPFIGVLISYTGDFKWTAYAGVPFLLLGTGLLIPFRTPSTHVGLLVLTQILCGIGSGLFAACGQLAVMAPITHQEVAVVLAIWGLFGSIGAAVGLAIAGAIWNNVLPQQIYQRLPEESKNLSATIFGSIVTQQSYPDGSPIRDAIVGAYADVQRKMVIAGACFMPLVLGSIYVWRNLNVKKLERERGTQARGNIW